VSTSRARSRRPTRHRAAAAGGALGLLLVLVALGAGGGAQESTSLFAHDGHAWRRLDEGEKLALLTGFLIGAALEQGLSVSAEAPMSPPVFLESLRKDRRLRFPFAPSVYKARLEDFYYYQDRLDIPLYRALFLINEQIAQGGRAR
jgi:hypothetical protein